MSDNMQFVVAKAFSFLLNENRTLKYITSEVTLGRKYGFIAS
jgi:hypothetical protein